LDVALDSAAYAGYPPASLPPEFSSAGFSDMLPIAAAVLTLGNLRFNAVTKLLNRYRRGDRLDGKDAL
jgi:hypothetical protein